MLPKSKKDQAQWRSNCPKEGNTCGEVFHRTLADAKARQEVHSHDLEIENTET